MPQQLPAVSLVAVPGRRSATLEVAREIERRGFAGVYAPSVFSNMSLCEALAHVTERIVFGTSIAPIYARTVGDFAQSAAFMHEVSGGRFRFGIGVSHAPAHVRMGVTPGKPLGDIRNFVAKLRAHEGIGALPPVILATLRKQMIALAGEIADGMVFANGARSHMQDSLAALPASKRSDPDVLHRQHDPDLHQRRHRGGQSGQPPDAHQLRAAGQLPQLLEGSRLRRGDGSDRDGDRREAHGATCRNT